MMNPWVKRKWVKALRSGEYEQGQGYLVYEDGRGERTHCCLGVLVCEMAPEFVRKQDYAIIVDGVSGAILVDGFSGALPDDLAIMYGLDADSQDVLAEKNDSGEDFLLIADWIERNL